MTEIESDEQKIERLEARVKELETQLAKALGETK